MEKNQQNRIEIELSDEIAQGIYSNLAIISHSPSEFVLDFVRIVPGAPKAKVKSRIILSPERAKALFEALADNIKKYENNFGKIKSMNAQNPIVPINFGGNVQA
ncbi:MAG: DUF3467 domain-containing protein [Bacteroidales bacterium]|nr:DUF3467 domain-containing protein [Bacteroidales bacterium]